jgi:hypothetical protein
MFGELLALIVAISWAVSAYIFQLSAKTYNFLMLNLFKDLFALVFLSLFLPF